VSRPAAAWAITVRTRLYASTWAHTSLRTTSGVFPRSSPICIADLSDRRSSSACHRARYSSANSSRVACFGSRRVVTTTTESPYKRSMALTVTTALSARRPCAGSVPGVWGLAWR
jgi:hypothetical protein